MAIDAFVKDIDVRVVILKGASEDYKEGQAAFMEKRKPVFKGW